MKTLRKKIKIIVEKTDTGFSAFSEEFLVYTTGRTITELMNNVLEAANLNFEEENITITQENLKFEIDFKCVHELKVQGFRNEADDLK